MKILPTKFADRRRRGRKDNGGLVVVVPKAGKDVTEHFAHTYRMASRLQQYVNTAVIVERTVGEPPDPLPGVLVLRQRFADRNVALRVLELLKFMVRLRLLGYRHFFVRTSTTAAVPLAIAARVLGCTVMYWNCGTSARRPLFSQGISGALRSELPARLAFSLSHLVITGTSGLAEHYTRAYGVPSRRMRVLPNEIDLAQYDPATPALRTRAREGLDLSPDATVVLTIHRLSPYRRTQLYIPRVFEMVANEVPDPIFLLAGGGPDESALRAAVADHGFADRTVWLGPVPHSAVPSLYHAADVFFMPSYGGEGFPRVLLESMAMGIPFASTRVGGVQEFVPPGYRSRLTNPDEPEALGYAILDILTSERLARALSNEGLSWVKRFDAPLVAQQLATLASS